MDAESAKRIIQVVASVVQEIVKVNDKLPETGWISKFRALRAPSISVKSYLERIAKYARCSGECFVLALIYIDRLIQKSNCVITSLSVHRILMTSVLLAIKFYDDHYYTNSYYAKIGGMPTKEINLLEVEFLRLVNFTLYVEPHEYQEYHSQLCPREVTNNSCGDASRTILPSLSTACVSRSDKLVSSHPDVVWYSESPAKTNFAASSRSVSLVGLTPG